ncbi:hypothetical protein [Candidatus Palauibacter sp.]|uniref:hypothetical protein n=1 Tax=Candidatus Palauibacter sp. TaxID=3101350 RepID=UPI003B013BBE
MALTAATLGARIGEPTDRAGELLLVVSDLVAARLGVTAADLDGDDPPAPSSILDEARIRAAGWLAERGQRPAVGGAMSVQVGDVEVRYAAGMTGCLRHSGAESLLSDWIPRGIATVGDD